MAELKEAVMRLEARGASAPELQPAPHLCLRVGGRCSGQGSCSRELLGSREGL